MDGVLADFRGSANKFWTDIQIRTVWADISGVHWERLKREWPTFWADLDYEENALELWRAIAPFHPHILTALPASWPSGEVGKYVWVKNRLPKWGYHPKQRFHAVRRQDKQKYAKQPNGIPNILIDDLERNIVEWNGAGGRGIHYLPGSSVSIVKNTILQIMKEWT
jgi:hypothetical protein